MMSNVKYLALLLLCSVASGCVATPAGNEDPMKEQAALQESRSEKSADQESEQFPTWDWADLESPSPAEKCKVPDGLAEEEIGYSKVRGSVGFPFIPERFPHQGKASVLLAQVAFEDVRPIVNETPLEYFGPHAQKIKQWAEFFSQGIFELDVEIVPEFIEMPMRSTDLPDNQSAVVDLIAKQMPPGVDLSAVDATFIYWASTINHPLGGEGSLRIGSSENSYDANEDRPGLFFAAHNWHMESTAGFPYELKRKYTWGYLLHEIQHEQGLNTHAPGNGWATGSGQNQYPHPQTGEWSAVLASWELWLLGWIRDEQVHCVLLEDLESSQKVALTPQEIYGGDKKIAVIPIADDKVMVVESRRPINWTEGWDETDAGLMIYSVNPQLREQDDHNPNDCGNTLDYPKWSYYLFPDGLQPRICTMNDFKRAILRKAGQTVTYEGVRVTLEHSEDDVDYLSIAFASDD